MTQGSFLRQRTHPGTSISIERRTVMFARIIEFEVKPEKKEEFVKKVKNEVVPILRKQVGFLEILPLFPENVREEKVMSISLWATKPDAQRYERDIYPQVQEVLRSYLITPSTAKPYVVETTLCEHFVETLTA
jgi:heme-degrading monooxygenase HmoA